MPAIYLATRKDYEQTFADACIHWACVRTWPCPACKQQLWEMPPTVVIEWLVGKWDQGSDVIADFTWLAGIEMVMVTQRVRECLESRFSGFRFDPIEMWQDPKLKRPVRKDRRTKPRIWLPYEGPPLWYLRVTARAQLDLKRTPWKLLSQCSSCGCQEWETPPETHPLVVKRASWDGAHVFTIGAHSSGREGGLIYVTRQVRDAVERAGFTNIKFVERGVIS